MVQDTDDALKHEVVILGGGSAGITVAASLLKREPGLDVVIVDPADRHYYQPAFTLVGGRHLRSDQYV